MGDSVKLPDTETLRQTLRDAGIKGKFSILDNVLDHFTHLIGGEEKDGMGFFHSWELALVDGLPKATPKGIIKAVGANFPRIIRALVSDKEVQRAAIAAFEQ